jgi:Uma2 family endonuclease
MTSLSAGYEAAHEMRVRIGAKIRYPDVCVVRGPIAPTIRTLTDAVAVFDVLSDDTAAIDAQIKTDDYAAIPSVQYYILRPEDDRADGACPA